MKYKWGKDKIIVINWWFLFGTLIIMLIMFIMKEVR